MKTPHLVALGLLAAGILLILVAGTMGERVIVDAMDDGRPIIANQPHRPLQGAGLALMAASLVAFAAGFFGRSKPAASPPPAEAAEDGSTERSGTIE